MNLALGPLQRVQVENLCLVAGGIRVTRNTSTNDDGPNLASGRIGDQPAGGPLPRVVRAGRQLRPIRACRREKLLLYVVFLIKKAG